MAASQLKHVRIDRELTLLAVATAARISSGRLSLIERGITTATADEQARLASVLGVAEQQLFTAEHNAKGEATEMA